MSVPWRDSSSRPHSLGGWNHACANPAFHSPGSGHDPQPHSGRMWADPSVPICQIWIQMSSECLEGHKECSFPKALARKWLGWALWALNRKQVLHSQVAQWKISSISDSNASACMQPEDARNSGENTREPQRQNTDTEPSGAAELQVPLDQHSWYPAAGIFQRYQIPGI